MEQRKDQNQIPEKMVPLSDTEQLIMDQRGQTDCRECSAHNLRVDKPRDWFWATDEKTMLCEVCPGCGHIRMFDRSILFGSGNQVI